MFYKIINWDTGGTIAEVMNLDIAKKHCRKMGHTGEHNGKWYLPVAFVQDPAGECVYNPRFKVGKEQE